MARLLIGPWLGVGRGLAGAGVLLWPAVRGRSLSPAGAGLLPAGVRLGSLARFAIPSLVVAGLRRREGPGAVRTAAALTEPGPSADPRGGGDRALTAGWAPTAPRAR
ncbi:MAG TPA: hypothetical protein VMW49_05195 [Candidatus Dormibacteraeota bacterium]|nr:hypothetical protein [Candidatus Dormibacteraeota bacterium]